MKKGFTLIELLAVIVILAIIALIATPIVLNIINDSKENMVLRSADNYLDAVELAIMRYKTSNANYTPSVCNIQNDANLYCDSEHYINVDIDGDVPNGGTILFGNDKITTIELIYGEKVINIDQKGNTVFGQSFGKFSNGVVVYYDVEKGEGCSSSNYNIENSKTGYNGIDNKAGNQNSCLKFYVVGESDNTVNLLLDHNTSSTIDWNSSGNFLNGPNEVLNELKRSTDSWVGTIIPQNYSENKDANGYSINYNSEGYKARLITGKEVANITNNIGWTGTYFSFDTNTKETSKTCTQGNTTGCKYGWLYDRTSSTCKSTGCLNNSDAKLAGYWTSSSFFNLSPNATHQKDCNGYVSYGVSYVGRLGYACVNLNTHYGVRPVIEVGKEKVISKEKIICTSVTKETKTTGNIPTGKYKDGDEYICKVNLTNSYHFFVVGTEGDNVNLILDRNININGTLAENRIKKSEGSIYNIDEWMSLSDYVASGGNSSDYGSEGNHNLGPITAIRFVQTATNSWVNIPGINIKYEDENMYVSKNKKGTTGYGIITLTGRARLPKFIEVSGDGKCTSSSGSCPLWLVNYMNINENVTGEGLVNIENIEGYWTLSSGHSPTTNKFAIAVLSKGNVAVTGLHNTTTRGVRPVITIPKSNIK